MQTTDRVHIHRTTLPVGAPSPHWTGVVEAFELEGNNDQLTSLVAAFRGSVYVPGGGLSPATVHLAVEDSPDGERWMPVPNDFGDLAEKATGEGNTWFGSYRTTQVLNSRVRICLVASGPVELSDFHLDILARRLT